MKGILAALAVATSCAGAAFAQTYPAKPVQWILPYAPGGGTDAIGRIVAEKMSTRLGVPVPVINQAGASGTLGSNAVRRAQPDGYTLLFNASVFMLGRNVVRSTPYDPIADFTPIARIGEVPLIMVANKKVEGATLGEVVRAVRADPNRFNFALSALGSAGHLATLEFMRQADIKVVTVPYRGAAPALPDLISGSVQLMIDPLTVLLPQVNAGQLKAIAVTANERSPLAPDVPTAAESGMPALVLSSWYGVWGPPNLPRDVVERISAEMGQIAKDPSFVSRLDALGIRPTYMTTEQFVPFMRADTERAVGLLRAANFEPE
jgi:tripartite-type tricarboxylate transporter receptor subunit TctC